MKMSLYVILRAKIEGKSMNTPKNLKCEQIRNAWKTVKCKDKLFYFSNIENIPVILLFFLCFSPGFTVYICYVFYYFLRVPSKS